VMANAKSARPTCGTIRGFEGAERTSMSGLADLPNHIALHCMTNAVPRGCPRASRVRGDGTPCVAVQIVRPSEDDRGERPDAPVDEGHRDRAHRAPMLDLVPADAKHQRFASGLELRAD